jgi:alpha-mannosidase
MTKEQLIIRIMKECEQDGEPVTREEAEEMAEMEIKAGALKHYEQSDKPRKTAKKERKVDTDKKYLLDLLIAAVNTETCIKNVKTETEFSFEFGENEYSVKLIKHRPKKTEKGD